MTDEYIFDEDEEGEGDPILNNPPFWLFEIDLDGVSLGRVFGPERKRNWVLWRISKYVLELMDQGTVSVRRYNNGEWVCADNWRNLAQ